MSTMTTMTTPATRPVDFGETAPDYARHRRGVPDALFARLAALGVPLTGRAVDLGAGTGAMALALARRGLAVTAVDRSAAMLAELTSLAGGLPVTARVAVAEDTGLPDRSCGLVTAATAWHWFDRPRAAAEARRLLVPGGALVIVSVDWRSSPLVDDTLAAFDAAHGGPTPWPSQGAPTYATWPAELERAGFVDVETLSFPCDLDYDRAGWVGRMRASTGFLALDEAHRADVLRVLTARVAAEPETFAVGHRCTVIVAFSR